MAVHQWLAEWSSWGWPLIANHLWQATLVSLVLFTAAGLLRNGPARVRYALRLIASAKFVLPSVLAHSAKERQALDRVRSWLGIRREVGLAILPGIVEPGVWGVCRPRVFLPQSMAGELTDSELEAVMMHEMIHVATI